MIVFRAKKIYSGIRIMNIIKKPIAVFFSILFITVAVSAAATADEPRVVTTNKTEAHRSVFDIPVYVVPVKGLSFTKTKGGCVDKIKKVSLEASQIRVSYQTLVEEFNEQNLKKAGVDLKLRTEFLWNGSPAMLLKVFQEGRGSVIGKWILVIGRGEETWMINGLYDAKDQKRGEAVLSIMKSVCWETEENLPPLAVPLGSVKLEETPLRLAGIMQGALVYTKDAELPTKSKDGSLFVISRLANTNIPLNKQPDFAKEKLEQIEKGKKLEILSEKEVLINGLYGIELVAFTEEEPKSLIYQTVLFDGCNSHILVGIARGNVPENLELFHKLAESYKLGI